SRKSVFLTYSWKVDGVLKRQVTISSPSDTFDLSQPGNGDKGQVVTVEVTPRDDSASGAPATASATVANTPPGAVSVDLTPAGAATNDTVPATVAASDADNDPVTLTYVWKVDGVEKQTHTGTATTDTFDLSQAGNGDRGQVITVDVTPSDGTASGAVKTATTTVANTPPAISAVDLTPTNPDPTSTLNATVTASDADNDQITFAYSWTVNGAEVRHVEFTTPTDSLDLNTVQNVPPNAVVVLAVTPRDAANVGATVTATVTLGGNPL